MGWIFSLVIMIGYMFNGDPIWLLTSGLFAISGGLAEVGGAIRKIFVSAVVKEDEDELW